MTETFCDCIKEFSFKFCYFLLSNFIEKYFDPKNAKKKPAVFKKLLLFLVKKITI